MVRDTPPNEDEPVDAADEQNAVRGNSATLRRLNRRNVLKIAGSGLALTAIQTPVSAKQTTLESIYNLDTGCVIDSSSNGNHGDVHGATPNEDGKFGTAYGFDGVDDYLTIPNVLSESKEGSISIWVYSHAFGEDKAFYGDWVEGAHTFYYDSGEDVWSFAGRIGGSIRKVLGGSPSTERWTHLVTTYDGSTLTLYVDGDEVDSTPASGSLASESDVQIGSDNGDHNYWDGLIDQVRLYSDALSPAEVRKLYENPDEVTSDLRCEDIDTGNDTTGDSIARTGVTDISYDYKGYAFEPSAQDYSPENEFIFPSIIETSKLDDPLGEYYMYCAPHGKAGDTKDGHSVGVALFYSDSLDSNSWTEHPDNPIISPDWSPHFEVSHISSPHALWIDEYDELFLYFHGENTTTRWATSTDGVNFSYGGVAVDTDMFSGASEASYARVFDYSIPNRDNDYTMFFMSNQGGTRHIRLATSSDAKNWTVDPDEVISPQPYHGGNVSGAFFFQYQGRYYLAFHASSDNMYVAEVGKNIDKEQYLGKMAVPTGEDTRIADPFFIKDDSGEAYMYYDRGGGRLSSGIAYRSLTDPEDEKRLELFNPSTGVGAKAAEARPSTIDAVVGERVTFEVDDVTGSDRWITSLSWSFGDGESSNGWWADHRYDTTGDYAVELEAVDNTGTSTTDWATILVSGISSPLAEIEPSTTEATVGERVTFSVNDTSGEDRWIESLEWTFDGNTTKTGWWAEYRFESPDTYDVQLTATDNTGHSTTDEVTITVS